MNARGPFAARLWAALTHTGPGYDPPCHHDTEVRAAAYREAAADIEAEQRRIEAAEQQRFGSLDHETELQGDAARGMAARLRARADQMEQQ